MSDFTDILHTSELLYVIQLIKQKSPVTGSYQLLYTASQE
jgi:hypothetical protein